MIYHSVGIVIGEVSIGKNLTLYQNVTIGTIQGLEIGDNATLYSGCCVLSSLGNNVTVGANTVITKSFVPADNCTLVGTPPRIVRKNGQKTNMVL